MNDPRKLTYHVGWKHGSIRRKEDGKPPAPFEKMLHLLLHPAPLPTERGWKAVLAVLPAAAFAALGWLAYQMSL